MSQNDIIIRTHYKSPHRLHIDSDIPTPSSEPINQFARQLITLLDTSDLSSMLSYCVTQEFTANCRKISQNCYSTALFTINFATSPIHTENILITLHYKKEIISLLLETTPIKANHLRSILDYIEQEQLTAEDRNHCMKLSKKIHREKNYFQNENKKAIPSIHEICRCRGFGHRYFTINVVSYESRELIDSWKL